MVSRAELQAFVKAKGAEILGLNNALVRLKKEVEERWDLRESPVALAD